MNRLIEILGTLDGYAWGPVTIILLLGTGIFLAFRMGFPQIRHFFHAIGLISGRYDNPEDEGALTHFQAPAAALSATIIAGCMCW
jgi:AGCS family alanine or glycine:cation symporter